MKHTSTLVGPLPQALRRRLMGPATLAALLALCAPSLHSQVASTNPQGEAGFRQFAPGLLVRARFATEARPTLRVALWDLLVGPGMRSAPVALPGAAVLEVRAGFGRVTIDGAEQELRPGAMIVVPEGARVSFANMRPDLGLSLRATLIRAGP